MHCKLIPTNVATVIELSGQRSHDDLVTLSDCLVAARRRPQGHVVVDLGGVTYIDSAMTGQLIAARHAGEASQYHLVLCRASETITQILKSAHLDLIFDIFEDRDSALAALQRGLDSNRETGPLYPEDPQLSHTALAVSGPVQVVRTFIEAWNSESFEAEYDTLADEFRGLVREDYVNRRQDLHARMTAEGRAARQQLCKVTNVVVSGDRAIVECLRQDELPGQQRQYEQTFSLIRRRDQWYIRRVSSGNRKAEGRSVTV